MFRHASEKEIVINAPVEKVWNIVCDVHGYSKWNSFIVDGSLPGDGDLKVGAPVKIDVVINPSDKSKTYRNVVVKVDPTKEISWEGSLGLGVVLGIKTKHYQILSEGDSPGTCRYRQGEVFVGSLVPFAGLTSVFNDLEKGYVRMNEELKQFAEFGSTTPWRVQ